MAELTRAWSGGWEQVEQRNEIDAWPGRAASSTPDQRLLTEQRPLTDWSAATFYSGHDRTAVAHRGQAVLHLFCKVTPLFRRRRGRWWRSGR